MKVWGINEAEIPPWQKIILKVALPILKKALIALLNINKEVRIVSKYIFEKITFIRNKKYIFDHLINKQVLLV